MTVTMRNVSRASLIGLAIIGLGAGIPMITASAEPNPIRTCLDADNVWVSVQFDDAVEGGCATEFTNGLEALASAGFAVTASDDGFVNTMNGKPSTPGAEDWWAYAHSDASLTTWEFYEVGAKDSEPVAGSIEGWRLLHSYATQDNLPSTSPAALLDAPASTPSTSASPSPSVSSVPSATPTQNASATPSATARPTPKPPKTGV